MAKKIKRMLAMAMVLCMFVGMIPLQALAADGTVHTTETSPEGLTTQVQTTTENTTDAEGNKVVTVTIQKDTVGELENGADLERHQTNTESKTYDEDGNKIGSAGVEEGKETITDIVDLPEGGVPVTVPGEVGDSDVKEFGDTSLNGTTGDLKEGEDDTEYNQTTTTVTPGKVTVTTTGKTYDQEFGEDTQLEYTNADVTPNGTNDLFYHDDAAPEAFLPGYEGEAVTPDMVDGYAYVYVGSGNTSSFVPAAVFKEGMEDWEKHGLNTSSPYLYTGNKVHNPEDMDRVGKNPDGTYMTEKDPVDGLTYYLDQDGNRIYRSEKTMVGPDGETYYLHRVDVPGGGLYVEGWYQDGEWVKELNGKDKYHAYWGGAQQFLLVDAQGNVITTYCADITNPTEDGFGYNVENLEDAEYYSKEDAARIRSIAKNGYWGISSEAGETDPAEGSLEYMRQALIDAGFSEERLAASLNDGVALTATQMAIWSCSNKMNGVNFVNAHYSEWGAGDVPTDKEDEVKLMFDIYNYLVNLEGTQVKNNMSETVVTAQNAITNLNINVIEKDAEHGNNKDDNKDNDAYVTDLSFALVVEPTGAKDESLKVTLVTADGQKIVGRICGSKEDETEIDLEQDKQGNYWFRNVVLTEGGQTFTLNLEGVQNLKEGVYLYSSEVREGNSSQTLVGKAGGKRDFNVSVNLSFDLDVEEGVVVTERIWREEYDPKDPPRDPHDPPENPQDPPQTWNRPRNQRLANDGVEIPEEPVPLAAPVITGDNTFLWVAFALMVAFCMVAVNLFGRKRNNEAF